MDRESSVEGPEVTETGAKARSMEEKTADKETGSQKKSVCAELKAPRKKKEPQARKSPPKNREEVL